MACSSSGSYQFPVNYVTELYQILIIYSFYSHFEYNDL